MLKSPSKNNNGNSKPKKEGILKNDIIVEE